MAILEIRKYPDPVLKQRAQEVGAITPEIRTLIDDMFETMYAAPGLGLAAPQVGRSLRLFVYDCQDGEHASRQRGVLINPEFVLREGTQTDDEGCLSVDDYRTKVTRANRAVARGLDQHGKPVTVEGEGLMARLLQHEIDHLDGHLFLDRLSALKRNFYLKRLKKRQRVEAR